MKKIFLIALTAICTLGCVNSNSRKDHSMYWQKMSAEYYALCIQAYNMAKLKIDKALITSSKEPLAIIADIDETVLNNLPYNEMLIETGESFSQKTWSEWVNNQEATPIPGALDFFNYVEDQDIEIIYLSNRRVENYEPTKANLISAGFPFDDQTIMLLRDKDGNKESRRKQLSGYNVVLLLGDNLSDFNERFYKKSNESRIEGVNSLQQMFADQYILFPNLIYGTWEMGFEN
ncbi:MAG: 5'-nucleotidase, lipoprotein e(P4) family [Flavobacteriaceae bacterium]|nr:5'-nucleotidase, lipoprotein e(P4) family [Flavobacteriaceae bacterium]